MENVLVTGGAGFIGAYLVRELIDLGCKVVVVDTLQNVGAISYVHPEADFINMDICDLALYERLVSYDIDTVYHLAAQSAGEPSYDNPQNDAMSNAYGTLLVAKFCRDNNVKKLIYTSTVAVYGDASNLGVLDEESKIDPDSLYGVSKYSGEMYVSQLLKNTDVDYTIFRVFNTYGPGENLLYQKKGMVSIYISYVWKNNPVEVKGSLNRYRDFTYIDDTVNALILAASSSRSSGNVYNLSSGIKTTVQELLSTIVEIFGFESSYPIRELPGTPGDSFGFHSDSTKIKNDLAWVPKVSLSEGIGEYCGWVEKMDDYNDISSCHPFELS